MASNFKHKQELIEFFRENYPETIKVEFECSIDQGIVSVFKKCYLYDSSLNKKPINATNFYGPYETRIITVIEQNNIITEDSEGSQIICLVTIDLVSENITIDFHEITEERSYLGTFKI